MMKKLFGIAALAGVTTLLRNKPLRDRLFGAAKGMLDSAKSKASAVAGKAETSKDTDNIEALWADEVTTSPVASPPFAPSTSTRGY